MVPGGDFVSFLGVGFDDDEPGAGEEERLVRAEEVAERIGAEGRRGRFESVESDLVTSSELGGSLELEAVGGEGVAADSGMGALLIPCPMGNMLQIGARVRFEISSISAQDRERKLIVPQSTWNSPWCFNCVDDIGERPTIAWYWRSETKTSGLHIRG